ncbi:sensor histidine kinase [Methylobacterium oxalidis]|nr:PAS domain-containing sensor histidine kinase [Methylobacterium oxalidis]
MTTLTDKRHRALVAAIAEITWTTDAEGQVEDMPAWRAYTGQSAAEVRGWGWLDAIHPDDRAATVAAWSAAVAGHARYVVEYRVRMRDGAYRWFNGRAAPVLDGAGGILEWAGVCIDIEDRKRAEAELFARESDFRVMADTIPQLAWMADASGALYWYNRRWFDYTGTDLAAMRGWGWRAVHHPDHVEAVTAKFVDAVRRAEPWEDTFPLRGADGRYRWFLSRAAPIRDASGAVLRWFGTNTDITAEREAALALREASEEVQRYAYIVSHDLRAPLVNIMGFSSELELLRAEIAGALRGHPEAERLDGDFAESLGFIRAAVAKMDGLIAAILRLSREGERRFRPEPLDMGALVRGLADAQRHQAARAGAAVEIGPLPDLTADRLAVEQIFGNLLDNAVKYLDPDRPGRVAVAGRRVGEGAVFTVSDNGRGIAAADHARVFELFRRSGPQDRPGEGIGLAHVRALVRALGGQIDLASTIGAGTTFTVRLPLRA